MALVWVHYKLLAQDSCLYHLSLLGAGLPLQKLLLHRDKQLGDWNHRQMTCEYVLTLLAGDSTPRQTNAGGLMDRLHASEAGKAGDKL